MLTQWNMQPAENRNFFQKCAEGDSHFRCSLLILDVLEHMDILGTHGMNWLSFGYPAEINTDPKMKILPSSA